MAVECYAKVDFAHPRSKRSGIQYPSEGIVWFCHLRIVEFKEQPERVNFLRNLYLIPGFRWSVVERCADITWYENVGGDFNWEDVSEVCSFLSQEGTEEEHHIPILPFNHTIGGQALVVSREDMRWIFPECFSSKPLDDPLYELEEEYVDKSMPTEYLADYIRDRL